MGFVVSVVNHGDKLSIVGLCISILAAVFLGAAIANVFMYKTNSSKSYGLLLSLLPLTVCIVVLLVSDNFGAGLAIAGAFSLLKFKSEGGSAKEMIGIFVSVAAGIGCGAGFFGISFIFTAVALLLFWLYCRLDIWDDKKDDRDRLLTVEIEFKDDEESVMSDIYAIVSKYTDAIIKESTHVDEGKKSTHLVVTCKIILKSKDSEDQLLTELMHSGLNGEYTLAIPKKSGVRRM